MTFKYKGLSEDLQKTLRMLDESVLCMYKCIQVDFYVYLFVCTCVCMYVMLVVCYCARLKGALYV